MMVFAGSSNRALAQNIAANLGVKLGVVELSRFANDESRVWIREEQVDKEVVVVQSLSQPTDHNLIEFSLICDALVRLGVREITAVIPWLGYSKQDKVFRPGEPLSVKVIAQMLQVNKFNQLITFDLHNLAILGFFDIPVVNLSAKSLFAGYFKPSLAAQTMVVAPDAGSVKSSTAMAEELGLEIAYIDKQRDLATGNVRIAGINREIRGKNIIIFDDMVVTGSTLIEVAAFLKQQGALKVAVAATHHLYVPEVQEKLDQSEIDSLVVTDTVEPKAVSEKLQVLSVATLIAEELKKS